MQDVLDFFNNMMKFYEVQITLYGYTFTFFDLFIFTALLAILAYLIRGIFF